MSQLIIKNPGQCQIQFEGNVLVPASVVEKEVLGSVEVKGQKRVVKHLNLAIGHISTALKLR